MDVSFKGLPIVRKNTLPRVPEQIELINRFGQVGSFFIVCTFLLCVVMSLPLS